jgi:hypothetical protein
VATQVIGSLAVNNILPIQSRALGSIPFGPFNVPAGYSSLTIQFDLQQVSSLTATLTANVQFSLDGTTFQNMGDVGLNLAQSGYVLNGGVLTRAADDPLGPGPVRVFGVGVKLFGTHLTTRVVKGTLSCTEAAISGVTLMAF